MGASMFRSKIFWGSVLGVVTSVLIFEGTIKLGYSPVWSRVSEVLTLPGTRFADAIFSSGVHDGIWRSSGAGWQSLVILWSTRFSGLDAYGLQVIFVSGSIRTIGKAHCCRRALDESRKRLSALQRV